MSNRKKSLGFSVVEVVIILAVVAIAALAGWWVYNRQHNSTTKNNASTTSQSPIAKNVSPAPAVKTTSDLDKALQVLNQNDPSSANTSDTSQLSSQTSGF